MSEKIKPNKRNSFTMYQTLHKNLLALGDINFLVGIHMRLLDGVIKCISFYYHFSIIILLSFFHFSNLLPAKIFSVTSVTKLKIWVHSTYMFPKRFLSLLIPAKRCRIVSVCMTFCWTPDTNGLGRDIWCSLIKDSGTLFGCYW